MHTYYIESNGSRDGPHDLITIMRRIRAGKIREHTIIYKDRETEGAPAAKIPDIALFFDHAPATPAASERPRREMSLQTSLAAGWSFVIEHNIITVFSGAIMLACLMLGAPIINNFGFLAGGMLVWCLFVLFHHAYLLAILRLHRGQTVSADFLNRRIAPVLGTLIASAFVLALMSAGGFLLLIIPGIAVMTLYIFVPLLIVDRRYGVVEAMAASRLLVQKHGGKHMAHIFILTFLHFLCLVLILPIPLTLPIFGAALAMAYDDLCAA